jgi:hypothetical protein
MFFNLDKTAVSWSVERRPRVLGGVTQRSSMPEEVDWHAEATEPYDTGFETARTENY